MATPLSITKTLIGSRINDSIELIVGALDKLEGEELKATEAKLAKLRDMLVKLNECQNMDDITTKLGTKFDDTDDVEQDNKLPDVLIPYEDLKAMDEKSIMIAKVILDMKYNDGTIKIMYRANVGLENIDAVEEYLKTRDDITYDRPNPRVVSITNKNTTEMKDKIHLDDVFHCLAEIYYGQLEKIREGKESNVIHITSPFNIDEYVKSKGYKVVNVNDVEFDVVLD